MARRAALRPALAALAVAVGALHIVGIDWLSDALRLGSSLREVPKPMYTRLLQPSAPPPVVAPPPPPSRPRRPVASVVAPSVPQTDTPTAAVEPAPIEPAPPEPVPADPTPPVVAEAPAAAASAPAAGSPGGDDQLASWPVDTRLNYRLGGRFRNGDLYGSAQVQWQRTGAQYQVRVAVDITLWANMVMTSQGEVRADGLLPQQYEEERAGKRRGARIGESAVYLDNGRTVPRPEGVQDTASQFVELSHRFATGAARLEVGQNVSFWMARPGAVDLWTYDVVGKEVLQTQLGAVEAFHLKPRPIVNARGNVTAEMWFAPTLQYLPVRIRINQGDSAHLDLVVESIEQR